MSKSKMTFNSPAISNIVLEGDNNLAPRGGHIIVGGTIQSNISGLDIIELQGGHTVNMISRDAAIEEIIATNGTINFDNHVSFGRFSGAATVFAVIGNANIVNINLLGDNNIVSQNNQDVQQARFSGTKITIGSQGVVNYTGYGLPIKDVIMSAGAHFGCVINDSKYKLDAENNIQFNNVDLEKLVQVADFMYDKFGDQEDVVINYDAIFDLKTYHKLCSKFGKNTAQNFIVSKETLVDMYSVQKDSEIIESIDKMLVNSFLINSIFPEKQVIDFNSIDEFINDNYFELAGIAKNPLEKSFEGKFGTATEILREISSFLTLNASTEDIDTSFDVINEATKLPDEDIDVTGNIEDMVLLHE